MLTQVQSYAIRAFHVEVENRFALRPIPFNRYVEKPSVRPQQVSSELDEGKGDDL